jgi:hypothetical protein
VICVTCQSTVWQFVDILLTWDRGSYCSFSHSHRQTHIPPPAALLTNSKGRSPYEEGVVEVLFPDAETAAGVVRDGQQYDDRGHPVNNETRLRSREHVQASNEVMAAVGKLFVSLYRFNHLRQDSANSLTLSQVSSSPPTLPIFACRLIAAPSTPRTMWDSSM